MNSSPPPASTPLGGDSNRSARRQRKLRRRISGALVLFIGLTAAGFLAAAVNPTPQVASAKDTEAANAQAADGKEIYDTSCVSCHGVNLEGVVDRGPSLIGVGSAAVYFQVSSGRMPMNANSAQAERKLPKFDEGQTKALMAYIDTYGEGPSVRWSEEHPGEIAQAELRGDREYSDGQNSVSRGGELFRQNCASCHNFTGKGGALSGGKFAPPLAPANEQQLYDAMLTGPQNMPKFSDRQLTPEQKEDVVAFIKDATETLPQGGYGLGGFGPVTEGLAIWLVGIIGLIVAAVWIGSKA